jgi:hypothetical protein
VILDAVALHNRLYNLINPLLLRPPYLFRLSTDIQLTMPMIAAMESPSQAAPLSILARPPVAILKPGLRQFRTAVPVAAKVETCPAATPHALTELLFENVRAKRPSQRLLRNAPGESLASPVAITPAVPETNISPSLKHWGASAVRCLPLARSLAALPRGNLRLRRSNCHLVHR